MGYSEGDNIWFSGNGSARSSLRSRTSFQAPLRIDLEFDRREWCDNHCMLSTTLGTSNERYADGRRVWLLVICRQHLPRNFLPGSLLASLAKRLLCLQELIATTMLPSNKVHRTTFRSYKWRGLALTMLMAQHVQKERLPRFGMGPFTNCTAPCGGNYTRYRTVVTPRKCGRACPALSETRPCTLRDAQRYR